MRVLLARFAPSLDDEAIIDSFVRSPLDVERSLPNMKYEDLPVGSFAGNQMGYSRPFEEVGEYRIPARGLYLCGASTHPGGYIAGLCECNAARVLAAELDLPIWWKLPELQLDHL